MSYPVIPGVQDDVQLNGYTETAQSVPFAASYSAPLDGRTREMVLTGNVTNFGVSAPTLPKVGGCAFTLIQDATGGRTVGWDVALQWPEGIPATMPSGPNERLTLSLNSTADGVLEARGIEMS